MHHAYDPTGRVLYLGSGQRRSAQGVDRVMTTAAGTGARFGGGDGGLATKASVEFPQGVAVAADGSVYIATDNRIRRVAPNGVITTVAGSHLFGFSGDGGPATAARLDRPGGVAVGPDGSLYIADEFNRRVRRVAPNGIITTVAGVGGDGPLGEGGPATQADVGFPQAIAVAPDGSLYLSMPGGPLVRRVGPDGIIRTVAGRIELSGPGFSGDGGPATKAFLNFPRGLAIAPDGSLYIADTSNHRIRRVGPDGIIRTVAGTGTQGFSGDAGPARLANLDGPWHVAVAADGSLYFVELRGHRVRRVSPEGIITTIAGTGSAGFSGDEGPAAQASLNFPTAVAVSPDESVYIADHDNLRIRRLGPPLPGFNARDIAIASDDGRELYVFDGRGRHLRTLDTLTTAVRYRFTYDPAGRLTAVEDRAGLVTRIERDTAGTATAVVAPGGQRTTLTLDLNGYLASVAKPAGEVTRFTSSADGLLATLTDPEGQVTTFMYDALGRLTRDADPAGGFSALARTDSATGYTVTLGTALSRVTTHRVENLATGGTRRVTIEPSGVQSVAQIGTDGSRTITSPDGTITSLSEGPDPRFGMQAPVTSSSRITTPGGLISTRTQTRTIMLADPLNPLSLTTQTDAVTLNGRTATSTFDAALKTITNRTPAGRQTVDTLGRVIQVQPAGLEPTSFMYDLRGGWPRRPVAPGRQRAPRPSGTISRTGLSASPIPSVARLALPTTWPTG